MKIEKKQIQEIADLAQIGLSQEELEAQRIDLERISFYTEKLKDIDTNGKPCQTHPFGAGYYDVNRFRPDLVTNEDRAEEWTSAAPDSKGSYFRVPRTVEE
jgi:aspartyl-tRNA(Asn)/glutamyl-tRNA(Gln) amidotransferase subunit C